MEKEPRAFGRYRLLERLGGGGMAEVWLAEVAYSADVSKRVALKMIREDLVRVPQFLSLFIDEARITSRLSHANVAQVFDFGEEGGRPFLAMELVEGPDLETILRRTRELGQFLPQSFCAYVVAEVARGLAAAHGLQDAEGKPYGIVHRDVSPQNVLLSYAGEVKITDFGIARARDKITQTETGTVMGKFRYMSPEQVQGAPVDARSDLFSCGILLYELITGLQLFDGRTSAEVVDQIRYKPVPELVALRRDVDPALETVLRETLARDPAARCPDAATLARDLERYLHVAHPLFTQDEVANLVGSLLPRRSPGRVGQIAFAGTELATGAPLASEAPPATLAPPPTTLAPPPTTLAPPPTTLAPPPTTLAPPPTTLAPPPATAAPPGSTAPPATASFSDGVPEAGEGVGTPSQRKATLAGTGSGPPVPLVTTPARRMAGLPSVEVSPEAVAFASARERAPLGAGVADELAEAEDGAPQTPMAAPGTLAHDGSFSPLGRPAAGAALQQTRGTFPAAASPLEKSPGGLGPGDARADSTATLGRSPGNGRSEDPALRSAPGGVAASLADELTEALGPGDAMLTAPTRRASPGGLVAGLEVPALALEATRTLERPGSRDVPTAVLRPRRRVWATLAVVAALALLAGGAALLVLWLRQGSGTRDRSGGSGPSATGGAGDARAGEATDAAHAGVARDGGSPVLPPREAVAALDAKLLQIPILHGPRDDRILRALAAGAAFRLMYATVDDAGQRRLGPPPPEALVLPPTDPLAESVTSALEVLAERILLSGELPAEGKALLRPLPAELPPRAAPIEAFPGSALYALDRPDSALALELHLRATGARKGWRRPLRGPGDRRYLWPHLAVARDAVARLGELAPRSTLCQALRRYVDARPRGRKVHEGTLRVRVGRVSRQPIKKSPDLALELLIDLWNDDPHKPMALQPLEWKLHGVGAQPISPNFWNPEQNEPLAPGGHVAMKVTFSLPADQWAPALVLAMPLAGGGALWLQVESELLP